MDKFYYRWASSLGDLEDSPENIWGVKKWHWWRNRNDTTVFCGMYDLRDYLALLWHNGKKYCWWAGSDIRNLQDEFLFNDGKLKWFSQRFQGFRGLLFKVLDTAEHWVENEAEFWALKHMGIDSQICPSFLGDVKKFQVCFEPSNRPKVYTSVSGDKFDLYKWNEIVELADKYSEIEFHLYGNTKPFSYISEGNNVFVHGRVSKEQMNVEIKEMQGALRLLPLEGFSEIIAKSVLMGQWPISAIKYPFTLSVEELGTLKDKREPNLEGRKYYVEKLNSYPWVV